MFYVCFAFAFAFARGLLAAFRTPQYSDSWFACNSTLHGSDICNSKGMLLYSSYGQISAPQPSVMYPVPYSQWVFDRTFVTETLGIKESEQSKISGKFSGVFVPTETGTYLFTIEASHSVISGECFFSRNTEPLLIELDHTYSGVTSVSSDLNCTAVQNSLCTSSSADTNSFVCTRSFKLAAGYKYPLFGGMIYSAGASYDSNLTIKLYYERPSGYVYLVRSVDAVASVTADISGLGDGDDSSSASGLMKFTSNSGIIGGVCGAIAFLLVLGAALWVLYYNGFIFASGENSVQKTSGRGSGRGTPRRRSGSASGRMGSGSGSRKRSGSGSRRRSGSGSRRRSGSGSRRRSGSGSRRRSGSGSRRRSGSSIRMVTGPNNRMVTGPNNRMMTSPNNRVMTGPSNRVMTDPSNRMMTGPTNRMMNGGGVYRESNIVGGVQRKGIIGR